ncbi:hypothetical protein SALWKB2_0911 [Snodgrassella alvi wkB2]|nr:hypothetical protein SALWKB2_0911 [Snodgrassella alvi wkB2]
MTDSSVSVSADIVLIRKNIPAYRLLTTKFKKSIQLKIYIYSIYIQSSLPYTANFIPA